MRRREHSTLLFLNHSYHLRRPNFQAASFSHVEQNEPSYVQDYEHTVQSDIYHLPEQHLSLESALANECSDANLDQQPDIIPSASPTMFSEPVLQSQFRPELCLFPNSEETNFPGYVTSKLFPNQQLGTTLLLCFEELELFYPCVDRVDFYNRLTNLFLLKSTCQGKSSRLPKDAEHLSLAALTCMLLAIGTYLGASGPSNSEPLSSPEDCFREASLLWYAESVMLLSKFESSEHPNMDLLRYHILEIIYMTMLDRKGGMSRSLALAVDLAYSLGVHDEQRWSLYTTREKEYRRLLWWTLVYMDRRIALSFQRPLLLRLADFHVGDFTEISFGQYMQDGISDDDQQPSGMGIVRLSLPLPSKPPSNYSDWLLFIMRWCKVVAQVWDVTMSLNDTQAAADSIETADTSLTEIQKALPVSLRWNTGYLPNSIKAGEMDRACRFKVIVFEVRADPFSQHQYRSGCELIKFKVTNELRLLVRCSVLSHGRNITQGRDYEDTAQMTETLASSVINAIVTYLSLRNCARPWSTYASRLILHLSLRVAPILMARNAPADTSCRVIVSMSNAKACMQKLAAAKLFAAKKAYTQLDVILERLHLPIFESIPRLLNASEMLVPDNDVDDWTKTLRSWGDSIGDAGGTIWGNAFSLV